MFLLAATFSLVISAQLPPDGHNTVQLRGYTDHQGRETNFEISRAQATKQPRWSPDRGFPPLELSKALAVAQAAVLRHHPKAPALRVDEVSLFQIGDWELQDVWYYLFEFAPRFDCESPMDDPYETFYEVVLFDGTLVEPHIGMGRDPGN